MNYSSFGKNELYGVHIANVPCHTSSEDLKTFFNKAGNVVEVYLPPHIRSDSRYTFAFVRYVTDLEALNAIKQFDGIRFRNSKLEVSLSQRTQELMNNKRDGRTHTNSSRSIVRQSMPRLERNRFTVLASDERQIHQKLKGSLKCLSVDPEYTKQTLGLKHPEDIQSFMGDLKDVMVKISNVPFGVGLDAINFRGEVVTKNNLEDIIIQYHTTNDRKNLFNEVDIDLSADRMSGGKEQARSLPFFNFCVV